MIQDISILKKSPVLNVELMLEIEPLAPLSMVSEMPGSYYKTIKSPDKKMICGLFENILGWHFSIKDRMEITKELMTIRKKQKIKYRNPQRGSTYIPLLWEYFEQELVFIPPNSHYDDLWTRAYRRSDAAVHAKGTFNISYELIPEKNKLERSKTNPKQPNEKGFELFFKENLDKYPMFYSTPTEREYIVLDGSYKIKLTMDAELYGMITEKLQENNLAYLGNSEGWVHISLATI